MSSGSDEKDARTLQDVVKGEQVYRVGGGITSANPDKVEVIRVTKTMIVTQRGDGKAGPEKWNRKTGEPRGEKGLIWLRPRIRVIRDE